MNEATSWRVMRSGCYELEVPAGTLLAAQCIGRCYRIAYYKRDTRQWDADVSYDAARGNMLLCDNPKAILAHRERILHCEGLPERLRQGLESLIVALEALPSKRKR